MARNRRLGHGLPGAETTLFREPSSVGERRESLGHVDAIGSRELRGAGTTSARMLAPWSLEYAQARLSGVGMKWRLAGGPPNDKPRVVRTMSRTALRVPWYRFRVTFGRRWGGYLAIVLLIGLVGGPAMGSIAAARRTQSSFPTYLASTNPSNLNVVTAIYDPPAGLHTGYDPSLLRTIAHLPYVKHAESLVGINVAALGKSGAPVNLGVTSYYGSLGEYFSQDRVTLVRGRMADPRRADEAVLSVELASHTVLPPGGISVPGGVYSNAQLYSPGYGTPKVKPLFRFELHVVGVVKFNDTVEKDDVDASQALRALFTPALTQRVARCCGGYTVTYLQLDQGSRYVSVVIQEIERVLPKGLPPLFQITSTIENKAQQAIKPESIALGVFGAIAALASLLIAAQIIGRRLRSDDSDHVVMQALGAGPTVTVLDGLIGVLCSVIAGSVLAAAVAVALSPLAPLGPVRAVYPYLGVNFDWTVLGIGVLVLVLGLSSASALLAYRGSAAPRGATVQAWCRFAIGLSAACPRRSRHRLRARTRRRRRCGAGAFGHFRHRSRGRRADRHGHLRSQSRHAGLAPGALWMELELRARQCRSRNERPPRSPR